MRVDNPPDVGISDYVVVAEGKKHAFDPHTQGPVCGDASWTDYRFDPREVECKRCRKLIRKAWKRARKLKGPCEIRNNGVIE